MKFLIDPEEARKVEAWAGEHLMLDPHGDPSLGGAYRTTTLYLDTERLDVFHRTRSYNRRKYRLRRYGSSSTVFLERKTRAGDRVNKRRTEVPEEDLALFPTSTTLVDWSGSWFQQRLQVRGLQPACQVSYERTAFIGGGSEGPLRLTLDRCLRGQLTEEWAVGPVGSGRPFLGGQVILELKFRAALPLPFKQLIQALRLAPSTVSKYRQSMLVWGVGAPPQEAGNA